MSTQPPSKAIDLDSVLSSIVRYSKGKFSVFNSSVPISTYKNISPILWSGNWKGFLDFAQGYKINLLYIYTKADGSDILDIEVGYFIDNKYHMVRLGDTVSVESITNKIVDNSRKAETAMVMKNLEMQPMPELERDMLSYYDSKFVRELGGARFEARDVVLSFMNEKGIFDITASPAIELKVRKLLHSLERILQKRRRDKENELMPSLVMRCTEWAKALKIDTVYTSDIRLFLRQLGIEDLSEESEDLLELQVNNILEK